VARLAPGQPLDVVGCTSGYGWCDVVLPDGGRGWVWSRNLDYAYQDQRVPLATYGAVIGVPIVAFAIGSYWADYYRDRPWYGDRRWWGNRPPPPMAGWRPPPPVRPGWQPRPVAAQGRASGHRARGSDRRPGRGCARHRTRASGRRGRSPVSVPGRRTGHAASAPGRRRRASAWRWRAWGARRRWWPWGRPRRWAWPLNRPPARPRFRRS
jgi:uncharacterized protein YraI